ncbi:MAG: hypothetical protein ACFB20_02535 [Opitutales bacterium]
MASLLVALLAPRTFAQGSLARVTHPDLTLETIFNPSAASFGFISLQSLSATANGTLYFFETDDFLVTRVLRLPRVGNGYGTAETVFNYQTTRSGTFTLPVGDWLYFGDEDAFELRRVPLDASDLIPADAPALLTLPFQFDASARPQDANLPGGAQRIFVSANTTVTSDDTLFTGNALIRLSISASGDVTQEPVAFINDFSGPVLSDGAGALIYGRTGALTSGSGLLEGGLFRIPAPEVDALDPAAPLNLDQPDLRLLDNRSNASLALLNDAAVVASQPSLTVADEIWVQDFVDTARPRGFRLVEAFAADRGGAGSQLINFDSVAVVSDTEILFIAGDFATFPVTSILYRLKLPETITYDFWADFAFTPAQRSSGDDHPDLDLDGNGPNTLQFARNADPFRDDPGRVPRLRLTQDGPDTFLEIDILEWAGLSEATSTIRVGEDLTAAAPLNLEAVDTGVTVPAGFRTQWRRYRAPFSIDTAPQAFVRRDVSLDVTGF